ncbi:PPOX class F420-dependent oxidoreductase [Streptomyces sp. NPDC050560]|uniref:PPOX class F420-dependent oxidoreductase n=1 Tax=Streptomyces sp. NPDC050560 TaxID=3365630 RepID=UPI0037973822
MAGGVLSEKIARRVDEERMFAGVATVLPDGTPHLAVVWIARDGDDLVFATAAGSRKERDLRRDPRVTVLLNPHSAPYTYAEVRGTATVQEEGGAELLDRLSVKYEGKPYREFSGTGTDGAVLVRVTPRKVVDML